jgi:hypothetical protein
MNASDRIRVSDLRTVVEKAESIDDLKGSLLEIIGRIDAAYQDLIFQLRAEPTIFNVDPVAETEKVEGAKPGDIAIFLRDGQIDIQIVEEET